MPIRYPVFKKMASVTDIPWTVQANHASLKLHSICGALDLAQPASGLLISSVGDQKTPPTTLLQVESESDETTEAIVDSYIRDQDLVVHYAQSDERPVSVSVYWRCFSDDLTCGVDQIISLQTDQLDIDPTIHVNHKLPPGEIVASDPNAASVIHRPADASFSWLLAIHPSDCEQMATQTDSEGSIVVTFRLTFPRLEKGVIRRARLRAAVLPREGDVRVAERLEQEFLSAKLPLTT